MARIVVTGGAGFLGSHLCRALLDRGDQVVAIDNLVTGSVSNIEGLFGHRGFTFAENDVSNYIWVPGAVDAVMHLASPASPADFERIPIQILKVGGLGTHNGLGLAKAKHAKFFLASTSEVYGDPLVHPQPESYWGNVNPIGPRGVYDEAKRYAEAMTMAYHHHHGLDVRIVRIFNSILADEQVLYDDGVELRRESIGELARRIGDNVALHGYQVPAFDNNGTVRSSDAIALIGHRPSGPCFEVRTRYGRSIRVTGDHSLFVEGPTGEPTAKPVSELSVGERIAIAARIDVPERDRRLLSMLDAATATGFDPAGLREWTGPAVVDISDEFLWLLGLWVAEGSMHISDHDAFLTVSSGPDELDRAAKLFERDLGLHVVRSAPSEHRSGAIFVHGRLLVALWEHLGFGGNRKRIPGWILGLPLSRLKWFLEGYREGDGVHSGTKLAAARRRSEAEPKPGSPAVRHEFSTVSDELKDDLIAALGRFGICPSVGRYLTTFKQRTGDRTCPFWRITVPQLSPWSPLEWDGGVTQRLNARRTGDLVWAAVTAIDEIAPTALVYDFSVPGRENFLAGSGVMAHNTYGPQMRLDDGRAVSNFLVQALQGKPITIFGDGLQTRSFTYVDDEIRGFLALLDSDITSPVNIGNPVEYTIGQLAELAIEVTGSTSELTYLPLPVDDPAQRQPDITKARELLGWEPTVGLREGLERTAEYFKTLL